MSSNLKNLTAFTRLGGLKRVGAAASRLMVAFQSLIVVPTVFLAFATVCEAADVSWAGHYRFEAVKLTGAELSSDKTDKAYGLQHLVLTPKIVAADGISIFGRFDVLNDARFGINGNGQVTSVAGDVLGNGPGTVGVPTRGTDSNSWGRTQRADSLAVTELYVSWVQEFGHLIVGRAPIHFGLGTAFNSGTGLFDHYLDTRDMVAYKFVLGNLSVTPILGKVSESNLGEEDDVDDYILHVQYDNPESELSLGFIYDVRQVLGNDSPLTQWPAGFARTGSYSNNLMGFFFSQKAVSWLRANIEADLVSGDTGIVNSSTQAKTGLNAFGLAAEFVYLPPAESKWGGAFKLGMATGDDPGTTDIYEGYAFSRNYDVALLMFNHPLGRAGVDFFRTGMIRDTSGKPSNQIDSEALSNALYLVPSFQYRSKDNLSYGGSFIYARLNKDPIGNGVGTSTNLGYELDFNVTYKPIERLTWITEAGFLIPGDAWKGGTNGYENRMAYGIVTKAAISF